MVEISSEKQGLIERECVEIEDRDTTAHLYWGSRKISCKPCLLLYYFSGDKKE